MSDINTKSMELRQGRSSWSLLTATPRGMAGQLIQKGPPHTTSYLSSLQSKYPKTDVTNYEERLARSVAGEFTRVQLDSGEVGVLTIHPIIGSSLTDRNLLSVHIRRTTVTRVLVQKPRFVQTRLRSIVGVKRLEDEVVATKQTLENHRHKYYTEAISCCNRQWKEMEELKEKSTLSEEEKIRLGTLKNSFNPVLDADYQMCNLVPYRALSAQPGSMYYLQKLNHDIFGMVNHAQNSSTMHLFDERVGPKKTDHSISYLCDYFSKFPRWIHRVHLFLDNPSSPNKNCYMVKQGPTT